MAEELCACYRSMMDCRPTPLRLASWTGILPPVVATITILTYATSFWEPLAVVGIFTLFAGFASNLVGLGSLAYWRFKYARRNVDSKFAARLLAIHLCAYPLAIGYSLVGVKLVRCVRITITNGSTKDISSVRIGKMNGEQLSVGASTTQKIFDHGGGSIFVFFTIDNVERQCLAVGYVDRETGTTAHVRINPNLECEVDEDHHLHNELSTLTRRQ
jgi:hypothetical protein